MVKAKLVPAPGYVLIEPLELERKTSSGILLPENVEEKPLRGKVISLGETLTTEAGSKLELWRKVKVGSVVIYKKWAGNEYRPQGADKDLLFVKFEEILAIEE